MVDPLTEEDMKAQSIESSDDDEWEYVTKDQLEPGDEWEYIEEPEELEVAEDESDEDEWEYVTKDQLEPGDEWEYVDEVDEPAATDSMEADSDEDEWEYVTEDQLEPGDEWEYVDPKDDPNPFAYKKVQGHTDDLNSLYRDGAHIAVELKDTFDEIKDVLTFKNVFKKPEK